MMPERRIHASAEKARDTALFDDNDNVTLKFVYLCHDNGNSCTN